MQVWILDERAAWWKAIIESAARHGLKGKRIFRGEQCGEGLGFIRCHADPKALKLNHHDYEVMASRCDVFQDRDQVLLYEDKSGQFAKWGDWMPDTWRFTDLEPALALISDVDFPLVSKADVGASSKNVRILKDRAEAIEHVSQLFDRGIRVDHCAGGARSIQKGYALLQRFIPHDVTWRVNAIGNARAIFKRYCYPDRPVAQTGNVEPVMKLDDETESLLEYADRFFAHAGTRWCAVDVLKDGDGWKLLETSCAFPWPSPGECNQGTIFRTRYRWLELFDAMFSEWLNPSSSAQTP